MRPKTAAIRSQRVSERSAAPRRFHGRFRSADLARILLAFVLVAFSLALGFTPGWASEINGSDNIKLNVEIAPLSQCHGMCGPDGLPVTGMDPLGALIAAGLCGGTGVLLLFIGRERPATRRGETSS
ncbi:hypothetical protein ACIQC5_04845 [Paenarthrobacter sp. NPDC092416]|uniref:hypothetical protein n=1 Tax=Paenarthrobacter sp. NPDC092416 TaxID=3364386 RepID=UPI0038067D65